jgi:hypothetical protein
LAPTARHWYILVSVHKKNLAFHSISGNPYSGYGASSGYNYNQQQQWSAADYYQYESKAFHLAYCMIRKFDF